MKLFEHQEKALEMTNGQNRVAYYLDMGLGKTFVGSEKMMQFRTKVNLVVCQKSKVDDWVQHLCDYYGLKLVVYDLTDTKQFNEFINTILLVAHQSI